MHPNLSILEQVMFQPAFPPINTGTARTGDVVSFKNYRRIGVKFSKGIGTAGDDPVLTIEQGTDVAFGTNKPLNFTRIDVKQDLTHLSDVGQWTKVTQAAANTYTDTTSAEQEIMWFVEFKAEDLDIANDYDCLRAKLNDTGSTNTIGYLEYVMADPVVSTAPEDMASAIID